jgi:hypothetical protein
MFVKINCSSIPISYQAGWNKGDSQKMMTGFGTPRDVKGKHLKRIWELEYPEEVKQARILHSFDPFGLFTGGNLVGSPLSDLIIDRQEQPAKNQNIVEWMERKREKNINNKTPTKQLARPLRCHFCVTSAPSGSLDIHKMQTMFYSTFPSSSSITPPPLLLLIRTMQCKWRINVESTIIMVSTVNLFIAIIIFG